MMLVRQPHQNKGGYPKLDNESLTHNMELQISYSFCTKVDEKGHILAEKLIA